jgi:hypothetical protein
MGQHIKNMVGMKFGKLTVLSFDHMVEYQRKDKIQNIRYWLCQCECGKQKVINGANLRKEIEPTTSCGCARKGMGTKPGTAFRGLLTVYKAGAKDRDLSWELSEDNFRKLTKSPCHYTGILPSNIFKTAAEEYLYNGIDRLNNNLGYTVENCVACCFEINMMKKSLTKDKFIELCSKVAERFPNV